MDVRQLLCGVEKDDEIIGVIWINLEGTTDRDALDEIAKSYGGDRMTDAPSHLDNFRIIIVFHDSDELFIAVEEI